MEHTVKKELNKKKIKTITMYLPQFHKVKENDEWWGEGYTEWTAVRNAKSLFDGHIQPRIPLNNNYYDLLEKDIMLWQAELMKKYGIDGQCFYHYYFGDGKKILEKPAENLLKWKDVDMPFFFCWAMTSWIRSWSNIAGNSWAEKYEKKDDQGSPILLEQKYGLESVWRKHFEYLLPFFKDDRYIRVNNKPVFMFNETKILYCLYEMTTLWNRLAIENGLDGIYFIGNSIDSAVPGLDAVMVQAPNRIWKMYGKRNKNGIASFQFDDLLDNILKIPMVGDYPTYLEWVSGFDDTPRRGAGSGLVAEDFNPEIFYEGLCKLYKKSIAAGNEFLFINAWNEWGEGMYLEPDERYGYQLLEAVKKAQIDTENSQNDYTETINEEEYKNKLFNIIASSNKTERMMRCLDMWMKKRESQATVDNYLIKEGIKNVVIYGIGTLGKHLLWELMGSEVKVDCIIDTFVNNNYKDINTIKPTDTIPDTDLIIVTALGDLPNIYNMLKSKTAVQIVSIESIIYNM